MLLILNDAFVMWMLCCLLEHLESTWFIIQLWQYRKTAVLEVVVLK